MGRVVGPRAARRTHQQDDRAKATIAHMQSALELALERRAVEEGKVGVEVGEVEVHKLCDGTWRREVLILERGNDTAGHTADSKRVLQRMSLASPYESGVVTGSDTRRTRTGVNRSWSSVKGLSYSTLVEVASCSRFRSMTVRMRSKLLDLPMYPLKLTSVTANICSLSLESISSEESVVG